MIFSRVIKRGTYNNLEFMVDLPSVPTFFRSFKYTWEKTDKFLIAGPISPKILKFQGGNYLMANRYLGTWVYDPATPLKLKWIVVSKDTHPYFRFDENGKRHWLNIDVEFTEEINLEIVETKNPIEVSFSKIPFKPVLVFTDHCDFDSDLLLRKQREFFKEMGIKTTKGFFIKKHSHKGNWNSALEGNEEEYNKWLEDGHELCYHSLSQSKIPNNGNEALFNNFINPFEKVKIETWIDHGYQSYNVSKAPNLSTRRCRLKLLKQKGISSIWNYYDTAEAVDNLNQLDYNQISFRRVLSSNIRFFDKLRILYFFNSTEEHVLFYRKFTGVLKKLDLFRLVYSSFFFAKGVFPLFYKQIKSTEKLKRSQSIFQTEVPLIAGFQTITVKDWGNIFQQSYSRFKQESGLAILHTYFAFTGKHHGNTLFSSKEGTIQKNVRDSFEKLKIDIECKDIWNPTLKEFIDYTSSLQDTDILSKQENDFGKRFIY